MIYGYMIYGYWIYVGSNMKKKGTMKIPVRLRELRKHEEQL